MSRRSCDRILKTENNYYFSVYDFSGMPFHIRVKREFYFYEKRENTYSRSRRARTRREGVGKGRIPPALPWTWIS